MVHNLAIEQVRRSDRRESLFKHWFTDYERTRDPQSVEQDLIRREQIEKSLELLNEREQRCLMLRIGTPIHLKNLRERHFKRIRDVAELPKIRLYDLRHTRATMLLSAGVHPKVVSERLGHSSVVITLDAYSHVLPSMQENATAEMARMMTGN